MKLQSELNATRELSKNAIRIDQSTTIRPNRKRWQDYSRQHKLVKKKRLVVEVTAALSLCDTSTFMPTKVHFENKDTCETEILDIEEGKFVAKPVQNHALNSQQDKVAATLYAKDKFSISDRAYLELSSISKELPRKHELKKLASSYNSESVILPCPEGTIGVQQSLQERLCIRLHHMCKDGYNPSKVRVRLSGDGTSVARSMHVVNFTFTILEELDQRNSPTGNHPLAILKIPEKYEELTRGLSDIRKEVESLSMMEINGQSISLEYYLSGDWKFLALINGLDAASAEYACIWCKCATADRHKMDMEWSIQDTKKGARTIEEIKSFSVKPKSQRQFNCSRAPLFNIPIKKIGRAHV